MATCIHWLEFIRVHCVRVNQIISFVSPTAPKPSCFLPKHCSSCSFGDSLNMFPALAPRHHWQGSACIFTQVWERQRKYTSCFYIKAKSAFMAQTSPFMAYWVCAVGTCQQQTGEFSVFHHIGRLTKGCALAQLSSLLKFMPSGCTYDSAALSLCHLCCKDVPSLDQYNLISYHSLLSIPFSFGNVASWLCRRWHNLVW